ncbi:tryptophan 2,3-dioxygenase [Govanella unica]|uniref:Tryptophan 2,3-dioxygenase n=1 Tax=Govanella unica TaxID=2975056 RepID=A0A9X3Z7F7_9PROT|nr:tryptophan 2,3-dioxygenase [Govania unica]MDA5194013.1 tryptophan 2,3-dioxygenase [Govania unica]
MAENILPTAQTVDLSNEKIHWQQDLSYGDYLGLDQLLAAQNTRSGQHDEMLFIVIHQVSELWMKLSIHELRAALAQVQADDLRPAFKMLARVSRIQHQLIQAWEVLATMTPFDYAQFRDTLGQSSGFQSYQYRTLEFLLGNKNARMVEAHRQNPAVHAELTAVLNSPSFYDEALRLLARRGFQIPAEKLNRDWSEPYVADPAVEAAWAEVYRHAEKYWDLYELAEKLVDVEYHFQQWRFSHMKTVERIIGYKRGTGGTAGVSYLVKALDLRFFPELWSVRTAV